MLVFKVLRRTADSWSIHRGSALSASLAFFGLLSLAPVISATVDLVGWFMGSASARDILTSRAQWAFGSSVAKALSATVNTSRNQTTSGFTAFLGMMALLVGGSGVAGELRSSLNLIWGLPTLAESWPQAFRHRSREVLIVLSLLLAVLAASIAGVVASAAGHFFAQALPSPTASGLIGNAVLSLGALLFLFLLIHKYVPDADVPWRSAVIAALCTATVFACCKELLSVWIRKSTVGAAFGTGKSVIALLVWAYFSSAVILLGAECARAIDLELAPERPPLRRRKTGTRRQMT